MYTPLSSLVPNADDLLTLEPEELAGVLLAHLNSYGTGSGTSGVVQHNVVNRYNFFNDLDHHPQYPGRQSEVNRALMEAWAWLQADGFLIESTQPNSFFLSKRAQLIKSRSDLAAYRKASLLPKGQLHPLIAAKVYPAFLRGEYDTAVFQAFREVEISVRAAAKSPPDAIGTKLMRDAFRPADPNNLAAKGPLTESNLPVAEQEAMSHLFCGAIGLYKNPQSHRNVPTEPIDAAEVILFASHLLRIIDRLSQ